MTPTRLLSGFHPSFDALSAHADRSDVNAPRARVGLHVNRCPECAQTIADIRALGEAARTEVLPGAPADLWDRIAAGVRDAAPATSGQTVRPDHGNGHDTSSIHPSRRLKAVSIASSARVGLGVLMAAGVALAVVLMASGTKQDLSAAPPSRLTVDRWYVKPGTAVAMRYRPAAALADQQTVTVWAWYRHREGDPTWRWWDGLARAGTLRRSSAQEFRGSVILPVDALVAGYVIGDSLGFVIDRVPGQSATQATVLAADASGAPSFDALVAFLGEPRSRGTRAAESEAATQLAARYPDHPETWILTYPYKHHGVIGDIVKRFESRERVYDGWHNRLKARRPLSLQTEVLMANVAADLMDTARADFWVERLVREHGSSPEAPESWITRYRDVPRDSIPAILTAFEPVWQAVREPAPETRARALALANRSGDEALRQRWQGREDDANPFWVAAYSNEWLADSTSRAKLAALIRVELAKELRDTIGAPTRSFTARWTTNFKRSRRHLLRTRLAAVQLLDGDVRGARQVLDSLASVPVAMLAECQSPATLRWRAEAELRLGELDAARDDLAYLATAINWQTAVVGDSAPQLLGSGYSPASWAKAKEAAASRHRSCFTTMRDRLQQPGP